MIPITLSKPGFLIVLGAILFFSNAGLSQAIPPEPEPRLACDQPIYDFGSADNRKKVNHTFILKNDGSEPLVISNIHACCGASVQLGHKTIAPGANTTLAIRLSLAGRKGRINKSFYIHSNDRLRPIFQLRMIGTGISTAASDVTVEPEEIRTQENPPASGSPTREIAVRSRTGKPFALMNVEPPVSSIDVAIRKVSSGEYRIQLSGSWPAGELEEEELIIETDAPGAEEILVPFVTPEGVGR